MADATPEPGGSGIAQCTPDELLRLMSQVAGYVSIVCWIIVGFPQIVENYRNKSGESLSVYFLFVWLAGDSCSMVGTLLNRLPLPMILINVWYLTMDAVLIGQVYYYRARAARYVRPAGAQAINDDYGATNVDLSPDRLAAGRNPGKGVPLAPTAAGDEYITPSSSPTDDDANKETDRLLGGTTRTRGMLVGVVAAMSLTTVLVHTAGGAGVGSASTARQLLALAAGTDGSAGVLASPETLALIGAVFAWIATSFYVLSRLPQLYKNYVNKSCEGLSIWLFIFAVCGNLTSSAQIFLFSTSTEYLVKTLPFIVGSLGTLIFDFVIFAQFIIYREPAGNARLAE